MGQEGNKRSNSKKAFCVCSFKSIQREECYGSEHNGPDGSLDVLFEKERDDQKIEGEERYDAKLCGAARPDVFPFNYEAEEEEKKNKKKKKEKKMKKKMRRSIIGF